MVNLLPKKMRGKESGKRKEEPREEIEMVEPKIGEGPSIPKSSGKNMSFSRSVESSSLSKKKSSSKTEVAREAPFSHPTEEKEKKEKWTLPKETETGEGIPSPEVSLSPKKVVILPRIVRANLIFLLIGIMISLLGFTGVWWWTNSRLKKALQKVKTIQSEIRTVDQEIEPYLIVKQRIANIEAKFGRARRLLAGHIYWTNFFNLLEKYTIPEVSFNGFSGNTSGSIHLNAGALNLPAVGRQILAFKQASDFVEKAEVSHIVVTDKGVTFSLELTLKPGVFYLGR